MSGNVMPTATPVDDVAMTSQESLFRAPISPSTNGVGQESKSGSFDHLNLIRCTVATQSQLLRERLRVAVDHEIHCYEMSLNGFLHSDLLKRIAVSDCGDQLMQSIGIDQSIGGDQRSISDQGLIDQLPDNRYQQEEKVDRSIIDLEEMKMNTDFGSTDDLIGNGENENLSDIDYYRTKEKEELSMSEGIDSILDMYNSLLNIAVRLR